MLNFESVICTAKSLTIGLPVAIALTYLINLPIRSAFPIPYRFPWLAAAECILAIFAITWTTMRFAAKRAQDDNIVETIRAEEGT
jgi:putative ABC transport system permease protein